MPSKHFFISIIIPCLNNENTIMDCALSLLNQKYPQDKFEIIFVDNFSVDNTLSILEKLKVKVIKEMIKNPYVSRNRGAKIAEGEILAFTDANCIINKNWLSSINESMVKGADLSQGPGHITKQENMIAKYESQRLAMDLDNFWGDAKNLAIKKSIFFNLGGFFEYFSGSDTLLVLKAKFNGYKVYFNEGQMVTKRFPETSWLLIKKSWKYGKGEIMWDYITGKKRFYKMSKRFIKQIPILFSSLFKSRNSNELFISILDFIIKETRYLSYIFNYKMVKSHLKEKEDVCKKYWHESAIY